MPLLTLIIAVPTILGLLACFFLPQRTVKYAALAIVLIDLALVIFAAGQFDWSGQYQREVQSFEHTVPSHFQMREHVPWIEPFRISWTVGVDHLSMLMVLLTAAIGVLAVLCSWSGIKKREREFYFFLLVLQTGIMGTFLAIDLFLFYIFWELMLIPLYFLVGIWGSKDRIFATMKFVLYTLAGSVLMLIALIWMYYNNGYYEDGVFQQVKTYSFEVMADTQAEAGALGSFRTAFWPFLALFLAFAIKIPLFPLHTWLPDAHTEAPTAGSVILAGVLLKTGGYGIIRYCLPLFPDATLVFAPLCTWLAIIAIIYGAMTAIVQTDIKRLVAYSSVSHMGFVVLGIFSLNAQAMSGAILTMINHGISTSGLFLAVGMLYERTHTREMSKFGGLCRNLPIFAALTMVMVLSSAGLPGLNGFIGEFTVLVGSMSNVPIMMQAHENPAGFAAAMGMTQYTWFIAALAATGVIFGAVYLLIMYQKTFFGKLDEARNGSLKDLVPREWLQLAVLSVAAVWIGLFPRPILNAIQPATELALESVSVSIMLPEDMASVEAEEISEEEWAAAGETEDAASK